MKSLFWIVTLAASVVIGPGGSANASGAHLIALWEMDESSGSHTMYDSSGHGFDGRIGGEVGAARVGGARGYRFPMLKPDTPPTHPRHLVVVPHASTLNPGTGDFAVTLRLRTIYQFGNIVQKGQAT